MGCSGAAGRGGSVGSSASAEPATSSDEAGAPVDSERLGEVSATVSCANTEVGVNEKQSRRDKNAQTNLEPDMIGTSFPGLSCDGEVFRLCLIKAATVPGEDEMAIWRITSPKMLLFGVYGYWYSGGFSPPFPLRAAACAAAPYPPACGRTPSMPKQQSHYRLSIKGCASMNIIPGLLQHSSRKWLVSLALDVFEVGDGFAHQRQRRVGPCDRRCPARRNGVQLHALSSPASTRW